MQQVPFVLQKVFTSKEPSALVCLYWAMMLAGASIAVNAAVTTRKAVSFLKEVANIEDCWSRLPHPMSSNSSNFWGVMEVGGSYHIIPVEGNPNGWFLDADCMDFCLKDEGYFLWKLVDSVSGPLEAPENSAGQCWKFQIDDSTTWLWPSLVNPRAVLCRLAPTVLSRFVGNETFADKQLPPHLPWHRWLFNWRHVMRLVRSWNQQLLWHALLSDKSNWFLRGMMMSIFLGSQSHPVFCWLAIAVGKNGKKQQDLLKATCDT